MSTPHAYFMSHWFIRYYKSITSYECFILHVFELSTFAVMSSFKIINYLQGNEI